MSHKILTNITQISQKITENLRQSPHKKTNPFGFKKCETNLKFRGLHDY